MIICKSVIKIKNMKGEILNTFEIILNRVYEDEKSSQNVELIEIKDDKKSSANVDDYIGTPYYSKLKKLLFEHLAYEPSVDVEYLIRIFRSKNALDYINIERDSNPFSFTRDLGTKSKIKLSILTYELNAQAAIKNILNLDNLVDLDEKSLSYGLNAYISNNVLETLNTKMKIHSINIKRYDNETIELNKINNISIGKVYIRDYLGNGFKYEENNGLKIFYLRGICRGLGYHNVKIKDLDFFEFDDGNQILFIIDRGNVSKSKVQELFGFDVVSFYGKFAIGIVTKRDYTI